MADRRTDETPIAPPRSLAGASGASKSSRQANDSRPAGQSDSGPAQRPSTAASKSEASERSADRGQGRNQQGQAQQTQQSQQGQAQRSGQSNSQSQQSQQADSQGHGAKRPLAERVSSAVSAAGNAVVAAGSRTPDHSPPAPRPAPTRAPSAQRPRGPRKARLRTTHIDPWSVMKTSFLLSIAFGIVTVIAVAVVWSVLGAAGVWDSINNTVADVLGGEAGTEFDVENYVGMSRVMGFTMVVAVVDVILITAIATLAAFLYNLAAALLGGVEVTLAEDER